MLQRFTLGDTLAFTKALSLYPASAGWVLNYRLVPSADSGSPVTFASTASGDSHAVNVPAATTAAWLPGVYAWSAWVTNGTDSHTVEQGRAQLLINPRTAAGTIDLRSDAQTALDNVRATLRGKATADVLSYTINGRSLQRYSVAELIALESRLAAEVTRERRSQAIAMGQDTGRKISVRLGRA